MTDYIKREEALSLVHHSKFDTEDDKNYAMLILGKEYGCPSADVAPVRHGQWELNTDMTMHCSCCGELFRFDDKDECLDFMECAKYCIACGAKMDEVEDND